MKSLLLVSFVAVIACAPSFAQSPSPAAAAPAPQGTVGITPDERDVLMAASHKASQDPAVKAAMEKARAAMEAARPVMVAKNPALAPIFNKIEVSGTSGQRPRLTPEEGAQLRAGREAIQGTPEAAAWQKATDDFRAAMRQAMIAADPAVATILDKLPKDTGMGHASAPSTPAPSASVAPQ